MSARRILDEREAELLVALYHLRYLTAGQMQRLWYPGRSLNACNIRLSRLTASTILHRRKCVISGASVYSAGAEGLRQLRDLREGAFEPTRALGPMYLPHHLATNDVFIALAEGMPTAWDDLPFGWLGTLHAALHFEESRRDAFGSLQTRRALVRPDAIVAVGSTGPRVFVELDRSTECLREADARRSIRRKLHAYNAFITKGSAGSASTWYADTFADGRSPRLVFVLTRVDRQSARPEFSDRRLKAIDAAAKSMAPRLRVSTVYLDDVVALRAACAIQASAPPPATESPAAKRLPTAALATTGSQLSAQDLQALATFYRLAVGALQVQGAAQPVDPALRAAAHEAKAVLRCLQSGGKR